MGRHRRGPHSVLLCRNRVGGASGNAHKWKGGASRPVCSPLYRRFCWKPSHREEYDLRKRHRGRRIQLRSRSQRAVRWPRCNWYPREGARLRRVRIRSGQSKDNRSAYLFRVRDITQTDFITPASGAAGASNVLVRFTGRFKPQGRLRTTLALILIAARAEEGSKSYARAANAWCRITCRFSSN